ncbi:type II toxin-antitoxin system Phd/YefM family antitoxin [uncultured Pseudokineococcus sp.]|uniref:type II toxin-antitoxin system Phd/YefM family antitoxin n=1 Tax=uncultured Pseudokineococcus sp. TaxID=1642928 RepID=UPI002607CBC2|nr:type II toxin-antitoxin system prevent-host-death family antitoxin [uncultured Pseudokineococcus sp.]
METAHGWDLYVVAPRRCTFDVVDVSVTDLRADLAAWIGRARAGEDVVVTDRGSPVVRLSGIAAAPLLERLTREGLLSRPAGEQRPRASEVARVRAEGDVSGLVGEQRR